MGHSAGSVAGLHGYRSLLPTERRDALRENNLRLILLTGEPLRWQLIRQWRQTGHNARLFNLYSQTETAGTVCAFEIQHIDGKDSDWVPLGFPLKHCQIQLGREQTAKEPREICVSGSRLASGYLGDPQLTSERFALEPFQHKGFFHTRDLGYLDDDGALRYAGRSDLLVKIRGQRVELGEVEAALRSHPAVALAAVACRTHDDGQLTLTAYIVPADEAAPPSLHELTGYLRVRVSEAALPARVVILQSLPMTASGKLDRGVLPAQDPFTPTFDAAESDEALDEVSEVVRGIFRNALELSRIDRLESFFDLGGNSLMATRVVSTVRAQFGVEVSMQNFFDDPTVTGMARAVTSELIKQIESLSDGEADKLMQEAGSARTD